MPKEATIMSENTAEETTEVAASKRPRKLNKTVEGTTIVLEVVSTGDKLTYTLDQFEKVAEQLTMYGVSQKLGDAAAGKDGKEAVEAITKVADGLISGDWSIRAPAAPKVTKAQINENLAAMSDKERAAAEELLKKLGITK
jgi:hypothetical protein